MSTILQIFLFLQVFIMGVVAAVAARYALEHYRPAHHEPAHEEPHPQTMALTPEAREKLIHLSATQLQDVMNNSANALQHDLKSSVDQINNLVTRLATEIISAEMERYSIELNRLHSKANTEMGGISTEIAKHTDELKARIAQELDQDKQQLVKQIDTKLADAIGSFLTETLGHNVDLGSQKEYLVSILDEHKAELIKEVGDGSQTTQ